MCIMMFLYKSYTIFVIHCDYITLFLIHYFYWVCFIRNIYYMPVMIMISAPEGQQIYVDLEMKPQLKPPLHLS